MSRAPLAGRPPFATDEPDTIYETAPAPQRRIRQPEAPNPNNRTSAYDMYNGYLGPDAAGEQGGSRISGVGGIGMGLLNMEDDSDSEDEAPAPKSAPGSQSKHAALAAATARDNTRPLAVSSKSNSPPPAPKPIAAPQPGYAAPIAALNMPASPSPPHPQGSLPSAPRLPPALQIAVPKPSHPNTSHASPGRNPFADPSPSPTHVPSTPHPLQPPVTPITPAFARPRKSPGVTFSSPTPRPTMRGNTEDTLLPARGEKGDDFWRRFSMVAKMPEASKESTWLSKTKSGYSHFSRWVWVVGIILLILVGCAAGLGWYFTHNKPDHQRPESFGASGEQSAVASSSAAPQTTVGGSTVLKVTPTRTIDKRAAATPIPSGALSSHKRRNGHSRL